MEAMSAFTVAPADDMAEVAALFGDYARMLGVELCFQGFAEELAGLPAPYAPPDGALLLARDMTGAALGVIALKPLGEGVGEIKRLYVRPEGRGLGLGRALAAAIIEQARRIGYRELKLDTLPKLEGAITLYRGFGFRPIAPYGSHPYPGLLCFGLKL
jgi:GNAT superfamily N-acetyltransferase